MSARKPRAGEKGEEERKVWNNKAKWWLREGKWGSWKTDVDLPVFGICVIQQFELTECAIWAGPWLRYFGACCGKSKRQQLPFSSLKWTQSAGISPASFKTRGKSTRASPHFCPHPPFCWIHFKHHDHHINTLLFGAGYWNPGWVPFGIPIAKGMQMLLLRFLPPTTTTVNTFGVLKILSVFAEPWIVVLSGIAFFDLQKDSSWGLNNRIIKGC